MSIRRRFREAMEGGPVERPDSLRAGWESLAAGVIPIGGPPEQFRDMQGAFYAGAYAVITYMVWMSHPEVSDDEGLAALDALGSEMLDFLHEIGAHGIPHPFRGEQGGKS